MILSQEEASLEIGEWKSEEEESQDQDYVIDEGLVLVSEANELQSLLHYLLKLGLPPLLLVEGKRGTVGLVKRVLFGLTVEVNSVV